MVGDEGGPAGPSVDWSSIPVGVYIAVAVAAGVLVIALVVAGLIAYRRFKRSGSWRRIRLAVQSETLGTGPRRELAQLRLRLDDALRGADSAAVMAREMGGAGDLEWLAGELRRTGDRLARRLELFADGATDGALGGAVPLLTEQVDTIDRLASQLGQGAAQVMAGSSDVELDQLTTAVADELKVVGFRLDALRELSQPNPEPPR